MRRLAAVLVVFLLAVTAVAAAQPSATNVTGSQLQKRFKLATGQKLVVNKLRSSPGHYVAYDSGVQSVAKRARWGTFMVYLVTSTTELEADVTRLLGDTRTGQPGTPTAAGIYWERGTTLHGDAYWMAKRRYGPNVVLTWIGSSPVKKTDASWTRLHKALLSATK